jgi:hypothetical protein
MHDGKTRMLTNGCVVQNTFRDWDGRRLVDGRDADRNLRFVIIFPDRRGGNADVEGEPVALVLIPIHPRGGNDAGLSGLFDEEWNNAM